MQVRSRGQPCREHVDAGMPGAIGGLISRLAVMALTLVKISVISPIYALEKTYFRSYGRYISRLYTGAHEAGTPIVRITTLALGSATQPKAI